MDIKKFIGVFLSGVLLFNTIPVSAFTESHSGEICDGVSYDYCSDGTLVIKGDTGTESITDNCPLHTRELTSVYISNLVSFDIPSSNEQYYYFFSSGYAYDNTNNLEYAYIDVQEVGEVFYYDNCTNLSTLVFGENVKTLESKVFARTPDCDIRITIPSSVTSVADGWINSYGSGQITIVCEYGSEIYNWVSKEVTNGNSQLTIELMDVTAQSSVTADNTQKYDIIVPESIYLKKTEDGWKSETYLGVTGELDNFITVQTDKYINIIGDDIPSSEKVVLSTEDENTNDDGKTLKTVIQADDLENASDEIDMNGSPVEGYRIDYDCEIINKRIMKQVYKGCIRYVVTE